MCHLVLALPVLALVLFWVWPLRIAAPAYAVVVVLSGALYVKLIQAMRRPPAAGLDELAHGAGEVVSVEGGDVRVLVHGERWSARSPDSLRVGDRVRVTGVDGMTLTVRRSGSEGPVRSAPDRFQGHASETTTRGGRRPPPPRA